MCRIYRVRECIFWWYVRHKWQWRGMWKKFLCAGSHKNESCHTHAYVIYKMDTAEDASCVNEPAQQPAHRNFFHIPRQCLFWRTFQFVCRFTHDASLTLSTFYMMHASVTWLIRVSYMCDMTCSNVTWHGPFIRVQIEKTQRRPAGKPGRQRRKKNSPWLVKRSRLEAGFEFLCINIQPCQTRSS